MWAQWKSIVKEAIDRTAIVAKFLCLLHVTNSYIYSPAVVFGPSMFPTLNATGDLLLSEHISHRFGKVGPGDVVLIRSPINPMKIVTKRIVGMEGDRVSFFRDPHNSEGFQSVMVPKGHVWIEGDNKCVSRDSRLYGPVPYGLIEGKLILRIWPPDSFGTLEE